MSGPELPQPIYPTGPGAAGPGAPAPGGPPGPPPGFGPPPAPAPGQGGGGGSQTLLIVGGGLLVLVILAVVAVLVTRDDDGGSASGGGSPSETTERRSEPGPDEPGVDADRARRVAALQIIGASSSTVSCIAAELEGEPGLVDIIEDQPSGVALDSSSDARRYASIIMGCASVDELVDNLSTALAANGLDDYSVGCFEAQAMDLSSSDWEELVQMLVQPSRASELQDVLATLTFC